MAKVNAEIGCNHMGQLALAKEMISVAARVCKADAVKFQKRNARELLTDEQYNAPHPVPSNSFGDTYGQHREALELTIDQHAELKDWASQEGIAYTCSVWDVTSAREISQLQPEAIKIPSATNLNFELQGFLCENYDGEIHVSTGMTTKAEVDEIVDFYARHGRLDDVTLYVCTSGYPVAFSDVCLLEINDFVEKYGGRVAGIGFSGHHLGIAVDIAALTLGAGWIERHFTLDRTWKGTDHAASLEPDGLRRLCRDIRHVGQALTHKSQDILPIEAPQREKLKWEPSLRRKAAATG